MPARTSVVVATMDRRERLLHTVERLVGLVDRPHVIVVDNGSSDGSPDAVRRHFPEVEVIELGRNRGAPARNVGVRAATTPYVAFADDDSWWAPGALDRAADLFDRRPDLALVAARVLVGADERLDPVSADMARSPLPRPLGLPGPAILGFVACGAVVRRDAFLDVGGFHDLLFFLGEERLLALDLSAAGWSLAYVEEVVAHHHPTAAGDGHARRRRQLRNDLLTDLLRRPLLRAAHRAGGLLAAGTRDRAARGALLETAVRLPAALARRRPVPSRVERQFRLLPGG